MRYSYRGYAIVTKVRAGQLIYQVVRLSDGEELRTYRTFHDAQAAIDGALQQAA